MLKLRYFFEKIEKAGGGKGSASMLPDPRILPLTYCVKCIA